MSAPSVSDGGSFGGGAGNSSGRGGGRESVPSGDELILIPGGTSQFNYAASFSGSMDIGMMGGYLAVGYISAKFIWDNRQEIADGVLAGATWAGDRVVDLWNWGTGLFAAEEAETIDSLTGEEIGRIVVDQNGNAMIEPAGGSTVPAGKEGNDTHTLYPNGSNYQRLNPFGHGSNTTPHGHGHLEGDGPGKNGQGPSIDVNGDIVPWNSAAAHWPIR